jgi:macrodomain Ter protein organizer (MatP/YcbG family)
MDNPEEEPPGGSNPLPIELDVCGVQKLHFSKISITVLGAPKREDKLTFNFVLRHTRQKSSDFHFWVWGQV